MDFDKLLERLDKISETVITLTNEVQNLCRRLEKLETDYRHKDFCNLRHNEIDAAIKRNRNISAGIITGVITGTILFLLDRL